MSQKICVIGGGAAGIMCAATILENSKDTKVSLFEKNSTLGVKVAISGGGRCNVTTGINDINIILQKYIRGSSFLKPAMFAFPPSKVIAWFEDHGVELKVEEDLRVFPKSDVGEDVVNVFNKVFAKYKDRIDIHFLEPVLSVDPTSDSKFQVITKKGEYKFDKLVLTTGGNAYRHTGSTGDGYHFAKELGHSITPLGPSLNSFELKESWCKDLKGISFQNAKIAFKLSSNEQRVITGPALFTHFGVSGPAIFAMAAHSAFEKISKESAYSISFSPNASETFESLDVLLTKDITNNGSKFIINIVSEYYPYRFAEKVLEIANIEGDKKAAEISRDQRRLISKLLTGGLELTLTARRQGDEFVTAGGVDTEEVESKTMRSRINHNLFFAGEILNIDGLTGGFNLQAAWATGRMAGLSILK